MQARPTSRRVACAAVQRLDDDPIGALLDDDPVGMITVQIALTKNYLDKASPKVTILFEAVEVTLD